MTGHLKHCCFTVIFHVKMGQPFAILITVSDNCKMFVWLMPAPWTFIISFLTHKCLWWLSLIRMLMYGSGFSSKFDRCYFQLHFCWVAEFFIKVWKRTIAITCNIMCCRADALSMTTVDFMTKEDAVQYCERNGTYIFKVWNLILLMNYLSSVLVILKNN